jgi:hypothetical protein
MSKKPQVGRHSLFPGKEKPPVAALLTAEAREQLSALAIQVPCTLSDFVEGLIRFHGLATVKTLRRLREDQRA